MIKRLLTYKQLSKKQEVAMLLFFCLVYVIGLLCFSRFTSPLFPHDYGDDSAIFQLVGQCVANGKIMYKDIFDHKGPILFFIEALGRMISVESGVFFLQCIFGCVNLLLTYHLVKTIRKRCSDNWLIETCAILVVGHTFLYHALMNGNRCEEYSLPFITVCLLLFDKYVVNVSENTVTHPPIYSLVYGVCFTTIAFVRLNNAIAIFAGVLAIIVYLIIKKEYSNLLVNVIAGIFGCAIVVVPLLIYFFKVDAFYEMVYATFIYNFMYAAKMTVDYTSQDQFGLIRVALPVVLSGILIVINNYECKKINLSDIMTMFIFIVHFLLFVFMHTFMHYYTIFVPVYMYILAMNKKSNRLINGLIVFVFFVNLLSAGYLFYGGLCDNYKSDYVKEMYTEISDAFSIIPESEKDSVIGLEIRSAYYLQGNIDPCYKYYSAQKWWALSDSSILSDFIRFVEESEPLWVLTVPGESNEEFLNIINQKYELMNINDFFYMYRLVER